MGEGAVDGNEEWGMGNEEWGSEENESELTERSRSEVFELTLKFSSDEKYSLSDQIRRSSRSVSSNIAESWAKRLYPKAFLNKLTEYITDIEYEKMVSGYDEVRKMLIAMIKEPEDDALTKSHASLLSPHPFY